MARIKDYELDRELQLQDKVLGTDNTNNGTMNFSLEQLGEFLASRGIADPSSLDIQFSFAGVTPPGQIGVGEIYYNSVDPVTLTEIYISDTDLKGTSTGPLANALVAAYDQTTSIGGTIIELNDTQASQGADYGFYQVTDLETITGGYMLAVSLIGPGTSTPEVPQTEFVNISMVGFSGEASIGADGYTPVITDNGDGTADIDYTQVATAPAQGTLTIPTGEPGNSVSATTSTDTSADPNTHTVTFTNSDGSTPPTPIVITDGADGLGTTAIVANTYPVGADGTVTLVKENNGGNVVITGIGTGGGPTPPPTFSLTLVGISTREGNDNNAVSFTGLRPAGGSGFTYSITSATTTTSGWAVSANPGTDPDTFEATAGSGVFGAADVFVSMNVTDNNVNPPTTHTVTHHQYQLHTFRGTFIGSQYPAPPAYTMPANDRGRLTSGTTYAFSRPGNDASINWHALIAIPSEVATPAELRFNDGGFLTVPGTDVDHWGDTAPNSTYTLFYFEIPGTETNYQTTITF